jgi:thioredoxin 1
MAFTQTKQELTVIKKLGIITLIFSAFVMADFKFSTLKDASRYIGKGKPVLLEVGAESCVNCKKMNEILAPIMAKHPNYRIFDIILKAPAVNILDSRPQVSDQEKLKVTAIPVQIFYDGSGKEVYRHIGVLTSDQLFTVFKKLRF